MPGLGEFFAQQSAPIIGREGALAGLHQLADPALKASQVLVVTEATPVLLNRMTSRSVANPSVRAGS
jgi:hypothetical protein